MVLETRPQLKPNDAPPPIQGGSSGPEAFDLHLDHKLLIPVSARTDVTDGSGTVNFPSIYSSKHPVDSTAAAPPVQPPIHDYMVKSGDSLWKIAKNSLTQGNRHMHVDGEQIWQRIRDIVEANSDAHPELRANPFFITKGEHLIVPGVSDTQISAPHAKRSTSLPLAARESTMPAPAAYDSKRAPRAEATPIADGGHLANALKREAAHQARSLETVGDCARGPRQTLEHFGIKLQPMTAVSQGRLLEKSGLFDRVSASEVHSGDYGYRHWSASTIRRRGLGDLGDSFIVTNCTNAGWQAANDHMFSVPPAGGYYAPGITFLRPNAKFYAAYERYKATGQMTRL